MKNQPLFQKQFFKIDERNNYGKVFLVGAGSGDSDNLTLKADKSLKQADVIVYDSLIHPQILINYAGKKIDVGKRKGFKTMEQDEINDLLYNYAVLGKNVVRLKAGDPFVFGRGEEADYLRERFVDVEVVPGISACFSGAALFNIPLTYRNSARDIGLITASTENAEQIKIPENDTLIYYMGVSRLKDLSRALIKKGKALNTNVALISEIGSINQSCKITTIKDMPIEDMTAPGIIVIGDVVQKSYTPKQILFTGLDPEVMNHYLPGKAIHFPLIAIEEIKNIKKINIHDYAAVIFTSKTAVNIFFKYFNPGNMKIISIGDFTSQEIIKHGYKVDVQSKEANSDKLAELISKLKFKNYLYPCTTLSNNVIHQIPQVKKFPIYQTKFIKQKKINLNTFEGVFFSSPSTVDAFWKLFRKFEKNRLYYAMGKMTKKRILHYNVSQELIINVQKI